jgi:hypothetical protein
MNGVVDPYQTLDEQEGVLGIFNVGPPEPGLTDVETIYKLVQSALHDHVKIDNGNIVAVRTGDTLIPRDQMTQLVHAIKVWTDDHSDLTYPMCVVLAQYVVARICVGFITTNFDIIDIIADPSDGFGFQYTSPPGMDVFSSGGLVDVAISRVSGTITKIAVKVKTPSGDDMISMVPLREMGVPRGLAGILVWICIHAGISLRRDSDKTRYEAHLDNLVRMLDIVRDSAPAGTE